MAGMDLDGIIQDLNRRFAEPLPEFYKRRIIFWYDEDQEFKDKLEGIQLQDAAFVALTGSNNFAVKKLLAADDTTGNYLVYCPLQYDRDEENWLINIELYSEKFRADLNSIWMDEMGVPNNADYRMVIKRYRKFFNSVERRKSFCALTNNIEKKAQIHLAVMAVISGAGKAQWGDIVKAVLSQSLDIDENRAYQELVKYGAQEAFWAMIAKHTGYSEVADCHLGRLATHILLTAATRTLRAELLAGLGSFISEAHQANCYDMISEWLRSNERHQLYEIGRFVENEVHLPQRFMKLTIDDIAGTECFPCINECILMMMMRDVNNNIINLDSILDTVEKRRPLVWYDYFSCYYEGLQQVAYMRAFYLEHAAGFHLAQPKEIWDAYTGGYYKMDTYYRKFHVCFDRSLKISNDILDDPFKHVVEKIETWYNGWFLEKLGSNWTAVCEEELSEHGYIREVNRQESFYNNKIAGLENRVYVIVSDAFRYEVAAALTDQLQQEGQCKVTLNSMGAIFPTTTKFGMAALLPHKELSAVQKASGLISVLADGKSTESGNRDSVLKAAHGESVALHYKEIIGMKRAERQALVKGMDIVYIYHDKVDEASHTSDSMVFPACDEAMSEIKSMIRIICNDFGGAHIYITADHGFLYTNSPLTEEDKVDKADFANRVIEYGRRFCIAEKGTKPEYLMPVKFLDGKSDMEAFAPRENVRIKSGGGLNYVHGGISLQEMVVPVIEYQHLRNQSRIYQKNKEKYDTKQVEINLLSAGRKISNLIFSLNFYQKEAVSGNRVACNYVLYFVDSTEKQISDMVRIIADRANDNAQERVYHCNFNLKSLKYSNRESYYLVIKDEQGLQVPQREEFQIDIAFAFDEYDF